MSSQGEDNIKNLNQKYDVGTLKMLIKPQLLEAEKDDKIDQSALKRGLNKVYYKRKFTEAPSETRLTEKIKEQEGKKSTDEKKPEFSESLPPIEQLQKGGASDDELDYDVDDAKLQKLKERQMRFSKINPEAEPFISSYIKFNDNGFQKNLSLKQKIDTFFDLKLFHSYIKKIGNPISLFDKNNKIITDYSTLTSRKIESLSTQTTTTDKNKNSVEIPGQGKLTQYDPTINYLLGNVFILIMTRPTSEQMQEQSGKTQQSYKPKLMMIKDINTYSLIGTSIENKEERKTTTLEEVSKAIDESLVRYTGSATLPTAIATRNYIWSPEDGQKKILLRIREIKPGDEKIIIDRAKRTALGANIVMVPLQDIDDVLFKKKTAYSTADKLEFSDATTNYLKSLFELMEKQNILPQFKAAKALSKSDIMTDKERNDLMAQDFSPETIKLINDIIKSNIKYLLNLFFSSKTTFNYNGVQYSIDYVEWDNEFQQLKVPDMKNILVTYYLNPSLYLVKYSKDRLLLQKSSILGPSCAVKGIQLKRDWNRLFQNRELKIKLPTFNTAFEAPEFIKKLLVTTGKDLMTPMATNVNQLSLISLNLLSQESLNKDFSKVPNSFNGVQWKNLNSSSNRRDLLFKSIDESQSDIYCFQDVQCVPSIYNKYFSQNGGNHREAVDSLIKDRSDPRNTIAQIYDKYNEIYHFHYDFNFTTRFNINESLPSANQTSVGNLTLIRKSKYSIEEPSIVRYSYELYKLNKKYFKISSSLIADLFGPEKSQFAIISKCTFIDPNKPMSGGALSEEQEIKMREEQYDKAWYMQGEKEPEIKPETVTAPPLKEEVEPITPVGQSVLIVNTLLGGTLTDDINKIQLFQFLTLMYYLKNNYYKNKTSFSELPLLFVGDLNSTPNSNTYQLIQLNQIDDIVKKISANFNKTDYRSILSERIDQFYRLYVTKDFLINLSLSLRTSKDNDTEYEITSNSEEIKGNCVDYIFGSTSVKEDTIMQTLNVEPNKDGVPILPNKKDPSNHVAIGGVFSFNTPLTQNTQLQEELNKEELVSKEKNEAEKESINETLGNPEKPEEEEEGEEESDDETETASVASEGSTLSDVSEEEEIEEKPKPEEKEEKQIIMQPFEQVGGNDVSIYQYNFISQKLLENDILDLNVNSKQAAEQMLQSKLYSEESRLSKLINEIENSKGDIYCLQEIQCNPELITNTNANKKDMIKELINNKNNITNTVGKINEKLKEKYFTLYNLKFEITQDIYNESLSKNKENIKSKPIQIFYNYKTKQYEKLDNMIGNMTLVNKKKFLVRELPVVRYNEKIYKLFFKNQGIQNYFTGVTEDSDLFQNISRFIIGSSAAQFALSNVCTFKSDKNDRSDNNDRFILINTHLTSNYNWQDVGLLQILSLIIYLKDDIFHKESQYKVENTPVILCGDFNSNPNSLVFKLLQERKIPDKDDEIYKKEEIIRGKKLNFISYEFLTKVFNNDVKKFLNNLNFVCRTPINQITVIPTIIDRGLPTVRPGKVEDGQILDYIFVSKNKNISEDKYESAKMYNITKLELPTQTDLFKGPILPNKIDPSDHVATGLLIKDIKFMRGLPEPSQAPAPAPAPTVPVIEKPIEAPAPAATVPVKEEPIQTGGTGEIDNWIKKYVKENNIKLGNETVIGTGTLIEWKDLFKNENEEMLKNYNRLQTIGDGSCFIHALFICSSKTYRSIEDVNNKTKIALDFRTEVLGKLLPNEYIDNNTFIKENETAEQIRNNFNNLNYYLTDVEIQVISNKYKINFLNFIEPINQEYQINAIFVNNIEDKSKNIFEWVYIYNRLPEHFEAINYNNIEYNFDNNKGFEMINDLKTNPLEFTINPLEFTIRGGRNKTKKNRNNITKKASNNKKKNKTINKKYKKNKSKKLLKKV